MDRRVKIICTIGPATASEEKVSQLIAAGMDVARLNFSHGDHESHLEAIRTIRRVAEKMNKPMAILQDLQGPKIRIGTFAEGAVNVPSGSTFTITTEKVQGDATRVYTPYKNLPNDVKPGDFILLNDGLIRLGVIRENQTEVTCKVLDGGMLYDRRGISLPGVRISEPSLTKKDREDLAFGLEHGVDYVALSFVREAADLNGIREAMGDRQVPVVAKLETVEALENLDGIIEAADVVMVARGDLGAQISLARVPVVQKDIIERCRLGEIPVITATQMLDSMMNQPVPTRAEASDIANAVFDGTDAVMLSGETAFGEYPVKSVETMDSIIREAEQHAYFRLGEPPLRLDELSGTRSICRAAFHTARGVEATAIVTFTGSGLAARLMSTFRAPVPVVAVTDSPEVYRRMALYWGTMPVMTAHRRDIDQAGCDVCDTLSELGIIKKGDRVVVTAGVGTTPNNTSQLRLFTYN